MHWDPKFFQIQIFLDQNFFLTQIFFCAQDFLDSKFFFRPKFFQSKICFQTIFFRLELFWAQKFLNLKCFGNNNSFFTPNFAHQKSPIFSINFQEKPLIFFTNPVTKQVHSTAGYYTPQLSVFSKMSKAMVNLSNTRPAGEQ